MAAARSRYDYVSKYREVHIEDANLYDLDQLQLLVDMNSKQLKTLGKGGFGSIFVAHLPKRIDTQMKPYELVSSSKVQKSVWPHSRFVQMEALKKVDPPHTQVLVAVKKLSDSAAPEFMESLIREASRLRNLWVSRNVVKVYGIVQNQELKSPCIVMDIVHGCNLNAFLRPYSISSSEFVEAGFSEMDRLNRLIWTLDQTLWWKKKLEIFRELIFSLMLCHKQGIFHGDLKGENVLLDQFLIPKLADFGLSFMRKKDLAYFKSFGGSLFWVAPEICDAPIPPEEVFNDPYPSDVYSLGMILVEMFLEGHLPDQDGEEFLMDKLQGGSPIPLKVPPSSQISASFFQTQILGRIDDLVERCCCVDREDRYSLQECLAAVDKMYSLICNSYGSPQSVPQSPLEIDDAFFVSSSSFSENLTKFTIRFPEVPECVVLQPSKNMIVDPDGYLLIHYFCKLDFVEGVKYIVEKASAWDFHPSRDVLEMAYICVEEGSLSVLKFLAETWKDIVSQEINLVHEACNYDNLEILRFLVFYLNMDFDSYYESAQLKPIHLLAYAGKNAMIQVLLEKSVNMSSGHVKGCQCQQCGLYDYVNTVCNYETPLEFAVKGGQVHTVEFLLSKGGIVSGRKSIESFACTYGSVDVVKKLLELGYSFDQKHYDSFHPLHRICERGHEELLNLVKGHIKTKNDTPDYLNLNIRPPLHYLCSEGKTKMARILIAEMGADVKYINKEGNTFLHEVSKQGYTEMAQLLLSHGLDLNLENNYGLTALDIAVDMGHIELENLLLQVGGIRGKGLKPTEHSQQMHTEPESQRCQLTKVVQDGNLQELNQILAKESLTSTLSSEAQFNLVTECCKKGYLDILRVLHEHGVDIHGQVHPYGIKSPLHFAAQYGNVDIIKFLIEKGVQVNVEPKDITTSSMVKLNYREALHCATDLQHVEATEALLQAGANPNAFDNYGTTPMDRAIGYKNKRMIKLLIEHGFDTGKRDREDRTYMSKIADIY